MKKFYAVGKNVFVKEIEQENVVGGFVIPDSVNVDFTIFNSSFHFFHMCFILAKYNIFSIIVGNIVAFPKVAGTKVTLNGEKLIRVMVNDIVAVEREGE